MGKQCNVWESFENRRALNGREVEWRNFWVPHRNNEEQWILRVKRFTYHYVVDFDHILDHQPNECLRALRITRAPSREYPFLVRHRSLQREIVEKGEEDLASRGLWVHKRVEVADFVAGVVLTHSFFCGR